MRGPLWTIRQSSAKSLIAVVIAVLALTAMPKIAIAQLSPVGGSSSGNMIDPNTKLRTMRQAPSMNSDGTPSAAFQGNPGCNQNVMSSMSNVANFHFAQNVAVHVNTRQQPVSFSNCLTDLISKASQFNNLFDPANGGGGFSFGSLITVAFQGASNNILNNLVNTACTDVKVLLMARFTPSVRIIRY